MLATISLARGWKFKRGSMVCVPPLMALMMALDSPAVAPGVEPPPVAAGVGEPGVVLVHAAIAMAVAMPNAATSIVRRLVLERILVLPPFSRTSAGVASRRLHPREALAPRRVPWPSA